ncbi:DUF3592 domain-containing protein [Nocardia sp. NPDC052566]|uniref:Rv1733c family protein n=1 Tax=Nocardia sp. NPDC052566 TaxID=3364330 RepID=UPI0037C5B36B
MSTGVLRRTCRRVGLDRNPMRRREDRVQTVVAATLTVLFLVIVPVLAIVFGGWIYRTEAVAVQARTAQLSRVEATVTEVGKTPLYAPVTPAKVTWRDAGDVIHNGEYPSTTMVRPGETVTIWLDRSGAIVPAPSDTKAASKAVLLTSGVLLGVLVVFAAAYYGLRGGLDRRRLRQWESDWVIADLSWGNHA